jgi:hypothetical protein
VSIDAALGRLGNKSGVCTSSTRPTNPFEGQLIYETDTNRTLVYDNSAWLVVADNQVLSIDSANSRVGIGTTSPVNKMHVQRNGSSAPASVPASHMIIADSGDSSGSGMAVYTPSNGFGYIRFGDPDNGASGGLSYGHAGDKLFLRAGGTDSMAIDSSGNVGIGTTTPGTLLNVGGTTNPGTDGELYVESNTIPVNLYYTSTNPAYSGWKFYSDVTGTAVLQALVRANGDFESRTNSYGATSDVATKQDVVDAPSQWDDIKAVQLRKYRLIDDVAANGEDALVQLGVVAQELEAAGLGGLVVDADPDNDKPYKSVKYSVLLLKALGALQEAMARIEALEAN